MGAHLRYRSFALEYHQYIVDLREVRTQVNKHRLCRYVVVYQKVSQLGRPDGEAPLKEVELHDI